MFVLSIFLAVKKNAWKSRKSYRVFTVIKTLPYLDYFLLKVIFAFLVTLPESVPDFFEDVVSSQCPLIDWINCWIDFHFPFACYRFEWNMKKYMRTNEKKNWPLYQGLGLVTLMNNFSFTWGKSIKFRIKTMWYLSQQQSEFHFSFESLLMLSILCVHRVSMSFRKSSYQTFSTSWLWVINNEKRQF